jgi:voltage-gated potassium channel
MLGHFFFTFNKVIWSLRSILLAQFVLLVASAMIIAGVENIPVDDAVYFAFITGLTIGYGDIVPITLAGRIACVFIGLVGVTFTGIIVGIAALAVRRAWDHIHGPQ